MEKEVFLSDQATLPVCAREVLKYLVGLLCSGTQTSEHQGQKKGFFFFPYQKQQVFFFNCVAMITIVTMPDFKFSSTFFRFPVSVETSNVDCVSLSPSFSLDTL